MLELYQYGNSVCAQKVRITLAEKNLDWHAHHVDLFKSEQYHPDYLKLNPKGVVPTLVHDGHPIIESTLICEYIDEVFPEPPLSPKNAYDRAQMRTWSKMVDDGLHEGVTEISFSAMFRNKMKNMTSAERESRFQNIGDPKRRDRFSSTFKDGVDSPFVMHAIAAYEKAFRLMEQRLSDGRTWIMGENYTLADINMMPYIARLTYLGLIEVWIKDKPAIADWWQRAHLLPSFKKGISDLITAQEFIDMENFGKDILERLRKLHARHISLLQ